MRAYVAPETVSLGTGGLFLNSENAPSYLIWIEKTSVFKYAYHGLMINEFDGASFHCKPGASYSARDARNLLANSTARARTERDDGVSADDGGGSAAVLLHQARGSFGLSFANSPNQQIWSNILILAALALFIRFTAFLCLVIFAKRNRVTS